MGTVSACPARPVLVDQVVELGARDVTGEVDQLAAVVGSVSRLRWTWEPLVNVIDIRSMACLRRSG